MAVLKFASEDFPKAYPILLKIWPKRASQWDRKRKAVLKAVAKKHGSPDPSDPLLVDTTISRSQLKKFGERLATSYSTPWKYQKYFNPHIPLNKQSLKLRPGAEISFAIEGHNTTGRVDKIRRTQFRGDPNYVKSEITWSTKNIPLYLTGETKCQCRYCGTKPKSEETECRNCGAPLPDEC
jgi:hypothetical protein